MKRIKFLFVEDENAFFQLFICQPKTDIPSNKSSKASSEAFVKGKETFIFACFNSTSKCTFVAPFWAIHEPEIDEKPIMTCCFFTKMVTDFAHLVLMTSTGEASKVAQKPAATAAVKWQGMPSTKYPLAIKPSLAAS